MKNTNEYLFSYVNENEFKKQEKALKTYNMLAFKAIYFNHFPNFKLGKFEGSVIKKNKNEVFYELILPTNDLFSKIHGLIKLKYSINKKDKVITIDKITPDELLIEGHNERLNTYKGTIVSSKNYEKDIFKINLLNKIKEHTS